MTNGNHIPQEDLALYAMNSLSGEESAPIRTHLAGCEACRTALAEVAGDLSLVAMSAELHPVPQGARERFLTRIGTEEAGAKKLVQMPAPKPQASAWVPWLAAAALAVITIGLSAKILLISNELDRQSALAASEAVESRRAHEALDLMTAPGAKHVVLTAGAAKPAPSARAVYLASRGALILEASNLQPVAAGKTYELWLIPANGTAPIPAGLFRPDAGGSASVVLPAIPRGVEAKAFGITVENEGGSATPTAPIVLAGAAPSAGE